MISFRYHLVSIVAVLLALAIGLLAGASVLDKGLVTTLERQTERWQTLAKELQAESERLADFTAEAAPYLIVNRLVGQEVVIVTQDGVDERLVAETRQALNGAGARVLATLSARAPMGSDDPTVQQDLAEILGKPFATSGELGSLTGEVVAERLANGTPRRAGGSAQPDVLRALLEGGFFAAVDPGVTDATLRAVGGPGQIVVVVAGGDGDPVLDPQVFLVPLIRGLVQRGARVGAGESVNSSYGFVVALRGDGVTSGDDLVTVDDLDATIGGVALVMGLERLVDLGEGGHYGVSGDSLLPGPAP